MFLTLASLISVLALTSCQRPPANQEHPALQSPFVRKICIGNAAPNTCAGVAARCLFRSPVTEDSPLCQCKDKVADVGKLFKEWVAKENNGVDICLLPPPPPPPAAGGTPPPPPPPPPKTGVPAKLPVTFQAFLTSANPKLEDDLACCVAKVRGLFDDSGKILVKTWVGLASTLEDAAAQTAVKTSIATCAGTVHSCNSIDVINCVTKGCYDLLKA